VARRHGRNPAIATHRNAWLDGIFAGGGVDAVVAFGGLADTAFRAWRETGSGQVAAVTYRHVKHPTFPESASAAGQLTKSEGMRQLLAGWNDALAALRPAVRPEFDPGTSLYGEQLDEDRDLASISERDLPPGVPEWMRALEPWAVRRGEDVEEKRATVVVTVPPRARSWLDH
jgi:uracil-DNA glycosylase